MPLTQSEIDSLVSKANAAVDLNANDCRLAVDAVANAVVVNMKTAINQNAKDTKDAIRAEVQKLLQPTPAPPPTNPPPPPPPSGNVVLFEDFQSYADTAAFRASEGSRRILLNKDLYAITTLTVGGVARKVLQLNHRVGTNTVPQNELYWGSSLSAAKIGLKIRFGPGYTTAGTPPPTEPGASEGYKVIGGGWLSPSSTDPYDGRLALEIVGRIWQISLHVKRQGTDYIQVVSCGDVGTMWSDGLVHTIEIIWDKDGNRGWANLHIDGVVRGGVVLGLPFPFPDMQRVHLGQNRNRFADQPHVIQHIEWKVEAA